MKKCKDCNKEIDKYAIACEYCGKLAEDREKSDADDRSEAKKKRKD